MKEVVIVSAVRTAIGNMGGALKNIPPQDLGGLVIREGIARAGISAEHVEEVIMGQSRQTTEAANMPPLYDFKHPRRSPNRGGHEPL
ncbi:MAG TPA: hypothetical protein VNU93_00840 [Verrucomicrobiae bacterium]|nr:hypothetical protein [Verrucomicrobiae bacterium]